MHPKPIVSTLVMLLAGSTATGEDWPSWRGPAYDGVVAAPGQFPEAGFALEPAWSTEVGAGYSGISVAGAAVLTMHTDGVDDLLTAFDAASGSIRWQRRLGPMYRGHDGGHDGPVSTPVADGSTVFALGADGTLFAFALGDGAARWSVSLPRRFRARAPFWGFASTPIVAGANVIVQAGGGEGPALVALDRSTGATRWTHGRGAVEYRSPVLATLRGVRQVIVSSSRATSGIDPATGDPLWTVRFVADDAATPVIVDAGRFLLKGSRGATMFELPKPGAKPRSTWRSGEFRASYATPVAFGDHLYGFTDNALVCVDARTGERRWRSREPGGKGLIAVDGHLVILGAGGDVVVVEAAQDEYREKARLAVSDADGYSWPSFANGVIYVRNLVDLVAVRTVEPSGSARVGTLVPSGRFASFLAGLDDQAGDRRARIDAYMQAQPRFPIVEEGVVHFVYRGDAEDVAVSGTMLANHEEEPLHRVPGTDLFHRSYAIEPGARFEYRFEVDFSGPRPDPRNERRVRGNTGVSEVVTPPYSAPGFLAPYRGRTPGRVDDFSARTSVGRRRVSVFLPHGYGDTRERYPLVLVNGGHEWLERAAFTGVLDNLMSADGAGATAGRTRPAVVAFVDASGSSSHRDLGGHGTRPYVDMIANELVPELERRYRTLRDRESRIVLGHRGGAVAAACSALAHPDVFGHCITISYGRADTVRAQAVSALIAHAKTKPTFHVMWNRYEIRRPQSFDCREQSKSLVEELDAAGFEATGTERLDSAGWGSWPAQAAEALTDALAKGGG